MTLLWRDTHFFCLNERSYPVPHGVCSATLEGILGNLTKSLQPVFSGAMPCISHVADDEPDETYVTNLQEDWPLR